MKKPKLMTYKEFCNNKNNACDNLFRWFEYCRKNKINLKNYRKKVV